MQDRPREEEASLGVLGKQEEQIEVWGDSWPSNSQSSILEKRWLDKLRKRLFWCTHYFARY